MFLLNRSAYPLLVYAHVDEAVNCDVGVLRFGAADKVHINFEDTQVHELLRCDGSEALGAQVVYKLRGHLENLEFHHSIQAQISKTELLNLAHVFGRNLVHAQLNQLIEGQLAKAQGLGLLNKEAIDFEDLSFDELAESQMVKAGRSEIRDRCRRDMKDA